MAGAGCVVVDAYGMHTCVGKWMNECERTRLAAADVLKAGRWGRRRGVRVDDQWEAS